MSLVLFFEGVENPANVARIHDAAKLLGATCSLSVSGRLLALENIARAVSIYGRAAMRGDITIALGNERRGLADHILQKAEETLVIPTQSQRIKTINVAAAAAVAGWYILRGSRPQVVASNPDIRRPHLLVVGRDHVEIGSTLRSAAAFGFRDVLLDDRSESWFKGNSGLRREAFAAARRHKNALRVHETTIEAVNGFEEIALVVPSGRYRPIQREALFHGARQLMIVGARPEDLRNLDRVKVVSLDLEPTKDSPLRLTASIALAEMARQVGRPHPVRGRRARPRYRYAVGLERPSQVLVIEPDKLLDY